MTNIFYGIRRLLLLNAANYGLGDFPLDRPLSISARNNWGKSTAINALQFPFLSNMNDMSFPRSNEDTRKYYFPYDNSYVVSEIVTETGTYVVGAVGKGQASGHDYQLFAYQARLDIDDFLEGDSKTTDRPARNYKELVAHLAERGVWVKALQPKQMRDALMGKGVILNGDEKFTIGVFRLRNMTETNYRLFMRVFKNLLHMNNVNLTEIKRLLIDVLIPREGSTTVDFMSRYRILNEEVESAKAKADTAVKIAADVKKLAKAKEARDEAYGILRALYPRITTEYGAAHEQREAEIKQIGDDIEAIKPRMQQLRASQEPLQVANQELAIKQSNIKTKLSGIEEGAAKFALYGGVDSLQRQIDNMQIEAERLVGELQRTHPEDIRGIQAELKSVNQQIKELSVRMASVDNNLLFLLTERYGETQIQIIAKLLNRDLLSALPIGDEGATVLDEAKLFDRISEALSCCSDGYYDDGQVRINLEKLEDLDIEDYFSYDNIKEKCERQEKRRIELERDLEVAQDYRNMEKRKKELLAKIKQEESTLKDYQAYLEAEKDKPVLEKELRAITLELEAGHAELKNITDALLQLGETEQALKVKMGLKKAGLTSLEDNHKKVVPISKTEPMGSPPANRLPTALEDMVDTYLLALDARKTAGDQIEHRLALIESNNGLRFTSGQDEDGTIQELVEAIEGTEEYLLQQENSQKAVSVEIGALLKKILDRYELFDQEIKRFNRQMNSRKISNIKRIEFIVDGSNDILKTVKQIVDQDSLFSNPEKVHSAVKRLDELISKRGVKLSLENLFNLGIEVELENGKVTSSFNDTNIQSTGTGLTVKVVLNVMLLNRLLFIKDGQVVNIPIYIDEAGQIDPANQQTLIDQCLPAGFVPVFASVEAQSTADYWIALKQVDGRIYVDQEDWFHLSPRNGSEKSEEQTDVA